MFNSCNPCSISNPCNTSCRSILIRQTICVNGVPNTSENVYTNLTLGSIVPLKYGYSMTLLSNISDSTVITITGLSFALSVTIEEGRFKMFDLPVEGGKYELFIGISNTCNTKR